MRAWLLPAALVSLAACDVGGTSSNPIDAPGTGVDGPGTGIDAPPGCPRLWTVRAATGDGALIQSGSLVLTGSNLDAVALEVYQLGLTGDFDVRFAVESFTAGGTGAYVRAAISTDTNLPSRVLNAGFYTSPSVGIRAADDPNGTIDLQPTASTTGELRLARAGATVTITATAGATTATTTANYVQQPLRIGIQLGSNAGTVGPATTAHLSAFTVDTGTGATSDAFDCNSLRP